MLGWPSIKVVKIIFIGWKYMAVKYYNNGGRGSFSYELKKNLVGNQKA